MVKSRGAPAGAPAGAPIHLNKTTSQETPLDDSLWSQTNKCNR